MTVAGRDERALQEFRRQLLDLTLRNPLLNYRPSRRYGLDIIDEDPQQIIDWFIDERKAFKFHATKRSRRRAGKAEVVPLALPDATAEVSASEEIVEEAIDDLDNPADSLATPYTSETLQARLEATERNARLFYQERGIGALYLTVGMLVWYEELDSDKRREAPLILLPAAVSRRTMRSQWRLELGQEDPGVNISLAEKMKEHGLDLPIDAEIDGWEQAEAYLAAVRAAVARHPDQRWQVDERRMTLGFYSFARFLMWRDLDSASWPTEHSLLGHKAVQGMLGSGFREPPDPLADGHADLDQARQALGHFHEIMDIDSSQAETLVQVAAGRNLIVHGPPGTGKSQTISNIIADAVGRGKTVLFVAEKMAALQVVAARLAAVGLDGLCLELHSNKASKRALAEELHRTLALTEPQLPAGLDQAPEQCVARRDELNTYTRAVATAGGASQLSFADAVGLRARGQRLYPGLPACDLAALGELSPSERRALHEELQQLAAALTELGGRPTAHAFAGAGLEQVLPDAQAGIAAALQQQQRSLAALRQAAEELADALQVRRPDSLLAIGELIAFADVVLERPRGGEDLPTAGGLWDDDDEQDEAVDAWRELLQRRQELLDRYASRVIPEFWQTDLREARGDLIARKDSFFLIRWFSGAYKRARLTIRKLCEPPIPKDVDELIALAGAAMEVQRIARTLQEIDPRDYKVVGELWRGADTDAERFGSAVDWLRSSRSHIAASRTSSADWTQAAVRVDLDRVRRHLPGVRTAQAACDAAVADLARRLAMPVDELLPGNLVQVAERLQRQLDELSSLSAWAAFRRAERPLRARGLDLLLELVEDGVLPAATLAAYVDSEWSEQLIRMALRREAALADFDVAQHELAIARFAEIDQEQLHHQRYQLAQQHHDAAPAAVSYGKVGFIRRIANPSRRRLPAIRKVMQEAGEVVQRIKPVFLMSPLSIAAYLPPGGLDFDLVIFDEASQVRPADAIGAIARGRQVVIVGDPQQMPPTSFFDKIIAHDDEEEDEDGLDAIATDAKSILDLGIGNGMPDVMLRWHYRSRHQSLIALSNREFYDERLLIFPAPEALSGLRFVHVPEGRYDRGGTRTNPIEAERLARDAYERWQAEPDTSLGLVALSSEQRNAITRAVDQLRRADEAFDQWCNEFREPLFIKNLENVQGDERDVIFVSIGYGRPAPEDPVPLNFGPVNKVGGERRLNVLFTRSRRACLIYANFRGEDLRLENTSSRGVPVLARFLSYAETGCLPGAAAAADEPAVTDPLAIRRVFEDEVFHALQELGLQPERRVGAAGYRLAFALPDPSRSGCHLLGIECDGPDYHDARWARDRDRIRPAVLASLGWRLHRVWSTDWYRDRERCLARIREQYEAAKRAGLPAIGARPRLQAVQRAAAGQTNKAAVSHLYSCVDLSHLGRYEDVDAIRPAALADTVLTMIQHEAPIAKDWLCYRVVRAVCDRATERRKELVAAAVAALLDEGSVQAEPGHVPEQSFLTFPGRPVVPRDRSALDGVGLDEVHPAEIDAALQQVVDDAMGCSVDDAVKQACAMLGFTATARNRELMHARLSELQLPVYD